MNRRLSPAALGVALAAAGMILAGCTRGPGPGNEYVSPATVQSVPGTTVNRVTLTDLAVSRLGIRTTAVAAAPAGTVLRSAPPATPATPVATVIPLGALVYDPEGLAWTYTNPDHDTYLRVAVVVDHISADTVVLTAGPPVGTQVVTVGGQELLGAEYGVGEE